MLCGHYCSIIHTLIRKYFGGNISKWTIRVILTEDDGSSYFYHNSALWHPWNTVSCIKEYYGQWSICSIGAAAPLSTISSKYSKTNFKKGLFRGGMITNAFEISCILEDCGKRSTASQEQPLHPPQHLQKYLGTLWKVERLLPDTFEMSCIQEYYGEWSICSLGATAPSSTISSKALKTFYSFFFVTSKISTWCHDLEVACGAKG